MKIRSVRHNNRKKVFEVGTSKKRLVFPFYPSYLRDLLLYRLTLEAQKRVAESPLSEREIVRRLGIDPVPSLPQPLHNRMLTVRSVDQVSIRSGNSRIIKPMASTITEASSKNCSEVTNRTVTWKTVTY